jgi:arsenate reductase
LIEFALQFFDTSREVIMAVTIYHNPRCSKSRQTLQLITDSGTAHTVILYLEDPPSGPSIVDLAAKLEVSVAQLLRRGESEFKEASDLPDLADDERLADWVAAHPIVLERPIVVNDESGKAVIGRPPENVSALLSR